MSPYQVKYLTTTNRVVVYDIQKFPDKSSAIAHANWICTKLDIKEISVYTTEESVVWHMVPNQLEINLEQSDLGSPSQTPNHRHRPGQT